VKEGTNITAESSIRNEGTAQSGRFSFYIGGLVAGQASVARNPAKHNKLPSFTKVGHFNQNLNNDGMVR
jgi:hypothetical protein